MSEGDAGGREEGDKRRLKSVIDGRYNTDRTWYVWNAIIGCEVRWMGFSSRRSKTTFVRAEKRESALEASRRVRFRFEIKYNFKRAVEALDAAAWKGNHCA
jgi:hypothetical protein